MHCSTCGSIMEKDSKFCGECGTQAVQGQAVPQAQAVGENEFASGHIQSEQPTGKAGSFQENEYVQKGKKISKQFFGFALEALKSPMAASRRVTESDKVNGIIAHVLFALLLPLFTYIQAKKLSGGFIDVPFGSMVLQPFLVLLIFLAAYTAVNLGVAKLMKADHSFIEVLTRFGVFNVIPAAVLLVATVFSLLSINVFSFILFGIGVALFAVASFALTFSLKEHSQGGLDVFYGLIVVNVAMTIILLIIGDSIMGNIIEQIENNVPF
ncbi:zinc ribbon domain-containing protein [Sediminibacillus albus]|uniref:Zinc-ribbon domain-containing protein n=1 Tax=Sediminibacillus albus TaxID=407036 RepID=A0A1G8ZFJ3_9BACI|nr:zinc ribbon domain-containing protein [Sediminibacillus albus]SDK13879.1 hypothetical protein SAMN05216243_1982 [Sediminibacillus albus]